MRRVPHIHLLLFEEISCPNGHLGSPRNSSSLLPTSVCLILFLSSLLLFLLLLFILLSRETWFVFFCPHRGQFLIIIFIILLHSIDYNFDIFISKILGFSLNENQVTIKMLFTIHEYLSMFVKNDEYLVLNFFVTMLAWKFFIPYFLTLKVLT